MAGILHEFVQNTKILASQVNENFETVQNDMTELGSGLNTTLTNAITAAKNDLLEDIESVSTTLTNGKANTNIDNLTTTGKANILDLIAPNYGAGYGVYSGWTAPNAGWVNARHEQSQDNDTFALSISGVAVFQSGNLGGYSAGDKATIQVFVPKGSSVTFYGSGIQTVVFYPCKGN